MDKVISMNVAAEEEEEEEVTDVAAKVNSAEASVDLVEVAAGG